MAAPFPPGTVLRADPMLRVRDGGRVVLGGSPLRFLRLTERGGVLVKRWLAGEPPGTGAGTTALARRLVGAGMVHPEPSDEVDIEPVTVIVPVKDDQAGLDVTLAGLGSLPVVVVDDGSAPPLTLPGSGGATAADSNPEPGRPVSDPPGPGAVVGATVVRRARSGGPGIARQDGLALVDTPLVAFVDAGVELSEAQLEALCRWFADPEIAAVGPRVRSAPGASRIDQYEEVHSPLDLGPNPSPVGHGRAVSYLPTASLVARRVAVEAVGGFDPALRFGEDVDLVWRLLDEGAVRYDPSVVVSHPPRSTLGDLARQRFGYGLAAAPLAERHGSELAPVRTSGWSLAIWGLALAGRKVAALAVGAYTAVALGRKLSGTLPDHEVEAVLLAGRGHWHAGVSLADAGVRVWWPLFAVGSLSPVGRPFRRLVALAWLRKLVGTSGSPNDRAWQVAVSVLDDLAYGAGIWSGALKQRSARCLLPLLVNWPPNNEQSVTGR